MSSALAEKKKKADGERTANLQNDFFPCLLLETREWHPASIFTSLRGNFLGLISRVSCWVDQLQPILPPSHLWPSSHPAPSQGSLK